MLTPTQFNDLFRDPEEIYAYYDGPLLWASAHPEYPGLTFLSISIERTASRESWMVVGLSASRFLAAQRLQIELRDLYLKAEGPLYIVTWEADEQGNWVPENYSSIEMSPHQIDPDDLSAPGYFLTSNL
jgi:hypothetical protein